MSIGKTARELILANPTMKNDDILAKVKAQYPEAKTTYACIAWYKSDMRKKGILSPKGERTMEIVTDELTKAKELVERLEFELLELQEAAENVEVDAGGQATPEGDGDAQQASAEEIPS